jgi:hypothetical protein
VKQKRVERVERRRRLIEVNLAVEGGTRTAIARRGRGCLAFLTPGLLVMAAAAAHASGLL